MIGKFVSMEGPDGSGKTSVLAKLAEMLEESHPECVLTLTREPGGSPIAEQIRELILDPHNTAMDARTEAMLYAAGRRQHMVEKILPALERGELVITDRFVDSSLAYQGVARQLPMEEIWAINQFAIGDHLPDLTLLIDIPAEVGLERIYRARGTRQFDRLDQEDLSFHQRVRQAYLDLARDNSRFVLIDGDQSIEKVAQACYQALIKNQII